jgi:hypothetical protein
VTRELRDLTTQRDDSVVQNKRSERVEEGPQATKAIRAYVAHPLTEDTHDQEIRAAVLVHNTDASA